jgi:hypothetical protein
MVGPLASRLPLGGISGRPSGPTDEKEGRSNVTALLKDRSGFLLIQSKSARESGQEKQDFFQVFLKLGRQRHLRSIIVLAAIVYGRTEDGKSREWTSEGTGETLGIK